MVTFGAAAIATVWMLRLVVDNTVFCYVSVFMVGLFAVMISIPLDSSIYEKGEKKNALATSVYRNVFSMASKLSVFLILALLVNIFHISFMIAALSMFALAMLNTLFRCKNGKAKLGVS